MYQLNPELAKKADVIGSYISETGKYIGTFIRAEKLVSANKGTDGIGFSFKDDAGRECRFDVWTQKQNGEALSGLLTSLHRNNRMDLFAAARLATVRFT